MTIEQITALVNAGFTKDEIMAMTAPAQEPAAPAQAQQTAQEPAQEPAQQTAPAQAQAQLQQMTQQIAQEPAAQQEISLADVIKSNQAVMENISKLTAAVQANAIRTAVQPSGGQPAYTAEQAIAEIIAPPRRERN